ncbi:hypothetical protein [Streptomyces sp. CAU 1734]|uniref:hypothetical protein n=1 Tax=Streptomyces sp. CAU 1734 TaxID=3140360 RepID=UPI003260F84B
MSVRTRVKTGAAGLVAAACVAVLMAPAQASAAPAPTGAAGGGDNCVANLGTGTAACYPSFREAIKAATGGRVADAPTARRAAGDKDFLTRLNAPANGGGAPDARIADPQYVQGVLYEHGGYRGRTLVLQSYLNCNAGKDKWLLAGYELHDFNDIVSSVVVIPGCKVTLYQHASHQGEARSYTASTSWLGLMNDHASSFNVHSL